MITSTIILYYYLGGEGSPSRHVTLLLVIYGLAALMVSNIPYFSLKSERHKKASPDLDVGFRLYFDYTDHRSKADHVFYDCLTLHVIRAFVMVLNVLQAPAGEATERGESDAVRSRL